MVHGRGGRHRMWRRRPRSSMPLAIVVLSAALVSTGCVSIIGGHAVSLVYNPALVGGLPMTGGPSGPRNDAPAPAGVVENTDAGDIDRLALLSINDLEDYWQHNYDGLNGGFEPAGTKYSYDSADPQSRRICGVGTYRFINALYCHTADTMAWDRGVLLPLLRRHFGDMSITGTLAHEYGHAVQSMAGLITQSTPTIVSEQQADCFAGMYLRWAAAGHSPRFTLSTTDGLNDILAGLISLRDPVWGPADEQLIETGHGTALDRIIALQMGFVTGASACAGIDIGEIERRRGDLPVSLRADPRGGIKTGEVAIDADNLSTLMAVTETIFTPERPPTLVFGSTHCPDAGSSPPASYCPATNTIDVDLPALQRLGAPATDANGLLPKGDNTAFSLVMSRYVLALQREHGAGLRSATVGLRTACLTGVGQRAAADPRDLADKRGLILSAGDVDEAVAGILTNGLVASDVDGFTVPAGFTRILAFRSGLLDGDAQRCYERFP